MSISKRRMQEELDKRFSDVLKVLSALTVLLMILFTARDLGIALEDSRTTLLAIDFSVAAITLALFLIVLRWDPPARWTHPLGMAIILPLTAKNLATIYLTQDIAFATQTAVVILATGFVYLSVRWFVITLLIISIAWMGVMVSTFEPKQILAGGAPFVIAGVIAWFMLRNRIRFHSNQIQLELRLVMLERLVPMCASCKKVRTPDDGWHSVESYIADELETAVSHSLCPDCLKKDYPEVHVEIKAK